ncbi:MAG: hypothetical protein AB8G11_19875 [Saprospiraceae bacterium]
MKKLFILLLLFSFNNEEGWTQGTFSSEFFEVAIIDNARWNWDDKGTGTNHPGLTTVMRPVPPAGFYVFGDIVTGEPDDNDKTTTIALKPKPGFEHLLAKPTRFSMVWTDKGTGGDRHDFQFSRIECPSGYVALGMVGGHRGFWQPEIVFPECRCIKETYEYKGKTHYLVKPAQYESEAAFDGKEKGDAVPVKGFYDDKGSGADTDVELFKVAAGETVGKDYLLIPVNSFYASSQYDKFPTGDPYALVLYSDISKFFSKKNKKPELPKLTSRTHTPTGQPIVQRDTVPFYLVKDAHYNSTIEQLQKSPTYIITRTSYYKPVTKTYSQANDSRLTWSLEQSQSTEQSNNWDYNFEVGGSVTVGGEASLKPIGIGASASVSMTASFSQGFGYSWGGASSEGSSTTSSLDVPVKYNQLGVIYQVVTDYTAKRKDGTLVR